MKRTTPRTRSERRSRDGAPLPAAYLVVLLACDRPLAGSSCHTLAGIDEVALGRGEARGVTRAGRTLALRIADERISSKHARIVRDLHRWVIEDLESRNGVYVNGLLLRRTVLADGDVIELGRTLLLFRATGGEALAHADQDAAQLRPPAPSLATFVPHLARTFAELARVARTSVPILITGASGTGKELVARASHELSGAKGAFMAVNCGALPPTLLESELFGYKKGAFSGATEDRPGLIRAADGGTLFLDEIGDMPLTSQAALLRVLQEREVLPIGATRAVPVAIRIVAATHRSLADMALAETFRGDLHARLAGFAFELPRLAERREDLGLLVAALLPRAAGERAAELTFAPLAGRALALHDWPQNVRELEHALGVAAALATEGPLEVEHLPPALRVPRSPAPARVHSPADERRKDELVGLLEQERGNVSAVARRLGTTRVQIHRWLRRYGLDRSDFAAK